ncbi:hypothetical protein BpHYR1_013875 [Brachionus plicatilis]|uniref:Uncharacterized protein n=1 Tax=Brachionus plicatilis TaxID=10195 RepID=A0A3M7SAF8_BRAPC|nr:hypothetical protein BpHYR1_013875 [Brachionus plicatilis]
MWRRLEFEFKLRKGLRIRWLASRSIEFGHGLLAALLDGRMDTRLDRLLSQMEVRLRDLYVFYNI